MMMGIGNLVVLDETQLRNLAKVIRYQEAQAIHTTVFSSAIQRDQFLRDSATSYAAVLSLLGDAAELKNKFQNDAVKGPASEAVLDYVVYCCNDALQNVPNHALRKLFLEKIAEHVDALVEAVKDVDPADSDRVGVIAAEAAQSKDAAREFFSKCASKASQGYSKWLNHTNTKFEDMVKTHQLKLGYTGHFNRLADDKKFEVYSQIIEVSGRGKITKTCQLTDTFGKLGLAVKIFRARMMTLEIYSAESKLEEANKPARSVAASVEEAVLGGMAGAALAAQLVGVHASGILITLAGMPDGVKLARQIAHQKDNLYSKTK